MSRTHTIQIARSIVLYLLTLVGAGFVLYAWLALGGFSWNPFMTPEEQLALPAVMPYDVEVPKPGALEFGRGLMLVLFFAIVAFIAANTWTLVARLRGGDATVSHRKWSKWAFGGWTVLFLLLLTSCALPLWATEMWTGYGT